MENNFCKQCGKCCSNIAVDFNNRVMYRDGVQPLTKEFREMLRPKGHKENITFCECKFLCGNKCANSPKPEECQSYPSSPFAFLPDDCGFEGEIFIKNEHVKQKVRKLKEEILDYEIRVSKEKDLQRIIERHQAFIDKYKVYGSQDW